DIDAARNNAIADEKPFDLRSGVPVRLTAYELPNNEMLLHIAIHHIAFDGGSSQILTDELLQRLNGITPEKLPDLSDIAGDDHNEEYKAGFEFYREMFKGGVPANEMPVKCTRPQVIPAADEITHLHFDNCVLSAIQRAAKYFRVTDFEFIFAAVSMVVAQYCASDDVVLGIPSNMRNARSKNIIGMFVNSAPVRVMPVRTKTVREFLAEVSQIVRAATRTAWLPFSEIVKEFVPVNDTSRNPVFDVSVNYLLTEHEKKSGNVSITLNSVLQKMKRDFVITIYREDSTIDMLLAYSPELYEPALIGRFLQQLDSTIRAMTNFSDEIDINTALKLPETQLAELEALSMSAKADIPVQLLHKIFENAVYSVPDRVALIADDKSMTFNELNTEANKIAWSLISKGVKKGDSVVLLLPRRSSYFSALFGVLKAGAAFIPCDPEYPAERVRHIINDSGAVFIITAHEHISDYPKERVLAIDDLLLSEKQENPDVNLTGDDLAYMIYTSGSTGVPKGVMLRHRGICNFCMTHPANILYQTVKDNVERMLDVTTVSFDLSLKDTLGILCNAKTVIFASESQMNDPRALTELIKNHDADAINATPSRYMQYLEYKPFREALRHCKLVMAGGEHFPQTLLNQLREMDIPNIINTYGPTETTISSNMAFLNKTEHVTVGRPLLNVREYIIDTSGNLAPRGVVGELYIGGPGVALGYRNLPEQTSQRFIEFRGERFYHSGDYAKWNFEGNVQVLGRMDGQVKLRGLRIELGEIEAVLSEQPGVIRAVAAIKLIDGQEHLCAWYTSNEPLNDNELRSALSARLTRYMVPDAFTRLENIPVN
ncbi:MAG: amino acid adenylation domain-containing protein, partial [Synergistaceae bacterium]|nr:amino acid adenylation domain-containing protein [Synergistaceae bacterium]